MKKKQSKEKTSSRLDLNNNTNYQPLYYDGTQAHVGDLVKYHNLQWLADIRNNRNSHIVNLSYLVKVKGE